MMVGGCMNKRELKGGCDESNWKFEEQLGSGTG